MNTKYMYDIKFNQIGQLEDKSYQEQQKLLSCDPTMECDGHSCHDHKSESRLAENFQNGMLLSK